MTRKCIDCDKELIPGKDWSEARQNKKHYLHTTCNNERAKLKNALTADAAERNGLGRGTGGGTRWYSKSQVWRREQLAIQRGIAGLEPNQRAATPLSKPTRSQIRPTKTRPVPRARWGQSKQRDKLYTEAMRHRLRMNKWVDHEVCELRSKGPVENLEFCHTLSVAACREAGRLDWAEDDNNGFLLWGALNGPMKYGFHWKMDGPCAFYVPPEEGAYYDWMTALDIHTLWIEPTPEQLKYILLAADYATGFPLYSKKGTDHAPD